MQIMSVYFVQQAVVRELHITTAANLPNMFLIDIAPSEVAGVRALLKRATRRRRRPRAYPYRPARAWMAAGDR